MNLSLRQLHHFVVLCEERHFGHASERLALSQPALSRSLKALEDAYGVQLIERGPSGAVPTRSGKEILRIARTVLQNAIHLDETLKAEAGGNAGNVFAGVAPAVASLALSEICVQVLRAHPGVRLYTNVQPNFSLQDKLIAGTFDFILCPREALGSIQSLDIRHAGWMPLDIVVRAGHPLLECERVTVQKLSTYPVIAAHPSPIGRQARIAPGNGFYDLQYLHMSCDNYDVLANVTAQTDAAWISSRAIASDRLKSGELCLLDSSAMEIPEALELVVASLRGAGLSPATRLVMDDVVSTVQKVIAANCVG